MIHKVLFICHKNDNYSFYSYTHKSSGLYNSTHFIVEGLISKGIRAKIVEVIDNNSIDSVVTSYRPDIVVIEALWVVPEKFKILKKLHPKVKWFIHMHSGLPFLGLEGIAMEWLWKYSHHEQVGVLANSLDTYDAFKEIVYHHHLTYLPNVYTEQMRAPNIKKIINDTINIGCFGAIRPMKNQLSQAFAAIKFANSKNLYLRFHMNGTRVEVGGAPILKNLQSLFKTQNDAELVEHPWMEHEAFIEMLRSDIDIGMQISMSETFSVVTADYVAAGIPFVASDEINWILPQNISKTDSVESALTKLDYVWGNYFLLFQNQKNLVAFSKNSLNLWYNFIVEVL
jgi:hypothetical protein